MTKKSCIINKERMVSLTYRRAINLIFLWIYYTVYLYKNIKKAGVT